MYKVGVTSHMNFLRIQFHRLPFVLVLGKSSGGVYKLSGNLKMYSSPAYLGKRMPSSVTALFSDWWSSAVSYPSGFMNNSRLRGLGGNPCLALADPDEC